jgi:hypothetical protein
VRQKTIHLIIIISALALICSCANIPPPEPPTSIITSSESANYEESTKTTVPENESNDQKFDPLDSIDDFPDSIANLSESKLLELSPLSHFEYSVLNDSVTITGYIGEEINLVLPAEIEGKSVTSIGNAAFLGCTNLKSIIIPGSVEYINKDAFAACVNLETVTIMDGVKGIIDDAFERCLSLTSIIIPDSIETIYPSAFSECTSLMSINVSEGNLVYASQDGVLFNKDKTELIYCPYGKQGEYSIPNGVITIAYGAFSGCVYLTSLTIPDSVINIGSSVFDAVLDQKGEEVIGSSSANITVICSSGSYAQEYCEENGINYRLLE